MAFTRNLMSCDFISSPWNNRSDSPIGRLDTCFFTFFGCARILLTSEIAQLGRVTETTRIESALGAVQAFRLGGDGDCVAVARRATQAQF